MLVKFAGFELNQQRAELRGGDGEVIKLRPKTLGILTLLIANPGRLLSKQELMDSVWPDVHVGDDSLFQCIRELRTALGDERRQLIKLVSGRGYLLTADVSTEMPPASEAETVPGIPAPLAETAIAATAIPAPQRRFGLRRGAALLAAGLGFAGALLFVAAAFTPGILSKPNPPTVAVTTFTVADGDGEAGAMAANVASRLADALARIENIRVTAAQVSAAPQADLLISGELQKKEKSWEGRARMTRRATGEVVWTAPVSMMTEDSDLAIQQSRLAAGIGHPLALRLNAMLNEAGETPSGRGLPPGSAKVAIEQATASIVQTSRDRFAAAQTMLEKALAEDADNVDLAVALAALQLRGVQMVWYSPADSAAAERNARTILEHALHVQPNSVPVLEAYCRFLNATNEFVESLVACGRTLNFDPWNGMALYHIGLAQIQLGRFEDALATFRQADNFDTPLVSRWTWRLGVGWALLLTGHPEDALPWLQSSIAITPASGRSYMLLSAAYEDLGRLDEARAAMEKGLALRPGSNAGNVATPHKNASPVFLAASERLIRAFVAAGLPEG